MNIELPLRAFQAQVDLLEKVVQPVGWLDRSDAHQIVAALHGQGDGYRKCSTHPTSYKQERFHA